MNTLILISDTQSPLRALMDEGIEDSCRVAVYPSLSDLYPGILSEKPLLILLDGRTVPESELGIIQVVKNMFPHLKVLLIVPPEMRTLAAKALSHGADAYLMEPFYLDEFRHFLTRAYLSALAESGSLKSQRLDALSHFIQGLAAEINNHLTPILGTLQLLKGDKAGPGKMKDLEEELQCMQREAQELAKVVEELENFAKPKRPKRNAVSLRETVEKTLEAAEKLFEKQTAVEKDLKISTDRVLLDQKQIVAALAGMLHFLRVITKKKTGTLRIKVRTPDPGRILIILEGDDAEPLGEDVEEAFIPYYLKQIVQYRQELGLGSAYGLIRAHEGVVKIEPLDRGIRFHITLPSKSG